jgi:hypothetical protein
MSLRLIEGWRTGISEPGRPTRSTDGSVIHANDDIEGREGTDSDAAIDRRRTNLSENRKRSRRKFLELEGRTWNKRNDIPGGENTQNMSGVEHQIDPGGRGNGREDRHVRI